MSVLRNLIRGIFAKRALPRQPSNAMENIARGWVALKGGHLEEAEQTADAVLASAPPDDKAEAEAYYLRAQARGKRGNFHGALEDYESALEIVPNSIVIMLDQGGVLHTLDRFEDALSVAEAILNIDAQHAVAHNNRGLMLRELARLDEAEMALRRALQCDDAYHDARVNLALALIEQGRLQEAELELARVLEVDGGHVNARWNRAIMRLLRGEFAAGWRDYESRLERYEHCGRPYRYPRWDGKMLDGGVLLIYGEQGLGDDILFASCFEEAIARAGRCVIECEPRLQRLFARSFPPARVVGSKFQLAPDWVADEPRVAAQISAGSLPQLFRNRHEEFPAHRGYLTADPLEVGAWCARLDALGSGLKVGIAWTGGAPKTRRATRSLSLGEWLPILHTAQVHFVSLQYIDSTAEIKDLATRCGVHVHHWPEAIADYDKTAALVSALDLVISVTTSVVHLAGALGQRVWVLAPAYPEWRYLLYGNTMPWYPSARLFRQPQPGDWASVMRDICAALDDLQASRRYQ